MSERNSHILIKNIYYMLCYAFESLNQSAIDKVAAKDFENIWDLIAVILCQGINKQLRRGLIRDYVSHEAPLSTVRGRIVLENSIGLKLRKSNRLACEFDEYEENILLNRILKNTAELLMKSERVKKETRRKLRNNLTFFHNVDVLNLRDVKWNRLTFGRREREYQLLINICRLVADNLLLSEEKGELILPSFLIDQQFHNLFEKFVLNYFKIERKDLTAKSQSIKWDITSECDSSTLPGMLTDVYLQKGNHRLIIDTKYYSKSLSQRYEKRTVHSNNLYQIFAYVINESAHTDDRVDGMLLYAKTDEEITPDELFHLNGHRFWVKTIDLNREFDKRERSIRKQLENIANLLD